MREKPSNYLSNQFKKCKQKRAKRKLFCIVLLFFCATFALLAYLTKVVNPILVACGEAEANKVIVKSCNSAVLNISTVGYTNLVEMSVDQDGNVCSIVEDTAKINSIANALAVETQNQIDLNTELGFAVSVGTLSGIGFLMGKGSEIKFSLSNVGNTICDYYTTFSSAGINQTSHKIFVKITCNVCIILPFTTKVVSREVNYLLAECVIVGKVPQTYVTLPTPN